MVSGMYGSFAVTVFSVKNIFARYYGTDRRIYIDCCFDSWIICANARCGKKV